MLIKKEILQSRSTEMQEIIGIVPSWIIRYGIIIIFGVFLIFVFCSFYIKYPNTLNAEVVLTSKEQPFKISWMSEGMQVYKIFVKNGYNVAKNDTLLEETEIISGKKAIIISPVEGKVYLFKGGEKDPRESVIVIYPKLDSLDIQLKLQLDGSGMVRKNQLVLIRLDAYPAVDYGFLEAQISSIMPVPIDGYYRATLKLTNALNTSEGKIIQPHHFMKGRAEVILDDRTLFSRYFGSLF